jgi:hypothetical protein
MSLLPNGTHTVRTWLENGLSYSFRFAHACLPAGRLVPGFSKGYLDAGGPIRNVKISFCADSIFFMLLGITITNIR